MNLSLQTSFKMVKHKFLHVHRTNLLITNYYIKHVPLEEFGEIQLEGPDVKFNLAVGKNGFFGRN